LPLESLRLAGPCRLIFLRVVQVHEDKPRRSRETRLSNDERVERQGAQEQGEPGGGGEAVEPGGGICR